MIMCDSNIEECLYRLPCGICTYNGLTPLDIKKEIASIPSADVQPIINPFNNHPICPFCGSDLQGVIKDDG